ncbi:MAG: acetate--CoA ligase family protein, partial [Woeseiaceae bacterium]|nr:acetate--CoA ligase family protein [Woeseiaceae bacterium]
EGPGDTSERWRERLVTADSVSEAETMQMLQDFGITASDAVAAGSKDEVLSAAMHLGYPLVLKTAAPDIAHKTEAQGVVLDIADEAALSEAYRAMTERLGPSVTIAPMADTGVEMILGARQDPQFGPVVVIGMGGVLSETVHDVQFALPPFDATWARRLLDRLRFRGVLDGVRGAPAADIDGFCEMAARFSSMADALGSALTEIDLNPVIVGPNQSIAVDALVVGNKQEGTSNE